MPRAVFYLLWDRIRSGLPVGAYVKNRAKDGRYYWVFAVVTPLVDGYMSVRLKPSSVLLPTVAEVYAQVRQHEDRTECKPAESAAVLLEHLMCLGYHDYPSFQAAALNREMTARNAALSRAASREIECFERLAAAAGRLREAATKVVVTKEDFRFAPLNLRVQASGLGDDGKAIGVISDNYSMLSETIGANLDILLSDAEDVARTMSDGLFLAATAALQEELEEYFRTESGSASENSGDAGRLKAQAGRYRAESESKLGEISVKARQFFVATDEMRRLGSALAAVRVMGSVENAVSGNGAFDDLIADLGAFQRAISSGLEGIWRINNGIHSDIALLAAQSVRTVSDREP
jgi:aerotaxis receptor